MYGHGSFSSSPFTYQLEVSSVGVSSKQKKTILSRDEDLGKGGGKQNVRGRARQDEKVLAHSGWIGY